MGLKCPTDMSGEELRREMKRSDTKLANEIERVRMTDPAFKEVLDRNLELEDEVERRKNR